MELRYEEVSIRRRAERKVGNEPIDGTSPGPDSVGDDGYTVGDSSEDERRLEHVTLVVCGGKEVSEQEEMEENVTT